MCGNHCVEPVLEPRGRKRAEQRFDAVVDQSPPLGGFSARTGYTARSGKRRCKCANASATLRRSPSAFAATNGASGQVIARSRISAASCTQDQSIGSGRSGYSIRRARRQ